MPHPLRIQFPGSVHHVFNRGSARQTIFHDRDDRRSFLSLLATAADRHAVEVLSYCLMGNHYHLLLRTQLPASRTAEDCSQQPEMDRAMQLLSSCYTRRFNLKSGRDGPLFRSRYRSVSVRKEGSLLAVSRYIHRNPLELGVRDLAEYPWSSFGAFVGVLRRPSWLNTEAVVELAGGLDHYAALVESTVETKVDDQYDKQDWINPAKVDI